MSNVSKQATTDYSKNDELVTELMEAVEKRDSFIIELLAEREQFLIRVRRLEGLVSEYDLECAEVLTFPATGTTH